jgi:hypothetical protein
MKNNHIDQKQDRQRLEKALANTFAAMAELSDFFNRLRDS